MIHTEENDWAYFLTLDEAKADGWVVIKVWTVLQFFTLAGRKTTINKENLIPITDLKYLVLAKGEEKYYIREYRQNYTIDELFFYRRTLNFSGEDESIENLRRYIDDNRVWLLYTQEMINATNAMLQRLWKANLQGEGQVPYKIFLRIADVTLKLNDYKEYGSNLTGFKTCCRIQEENINELWKSCLTKKL